MEPISESVLRLLLLALPGILAARFYRKLRGRAPKQQWELVLDVLVFSTLSYAVMAIISAILETLLPMLIAFIGSALYILPKAPDVSNLRDFWHSLDAAGAKAFAPFLDTKSQVSWIIVIKSVCVGIGLAYFAACVHTHTWVNRLGKYRFAIPQFLGGGRNFKVGPVAFTIPKELYCSNRAADEDVWEQFLSAEITDEWIFVRDHDLSLIYFGHLAFYSESEKERELMLTDVSVFHSDNVTAELYSVSALYVARMSSKLTIEVPETPKKEIKNVKRK